MGVNRNFAESKPGNSSAKTPASQNAKIVIPNVLVASARGFFIVWCGLHLVVDTQPASFLPWSALCHYVVSACFYDTHRFICALGLVVESLCRRILISLAPTPAARTSAASLRLSAFQCRPPSAKQQEMNKNIIKSINCHNARGSGWWDFFSVAPHCMAQWVLRVQRVPAFFSVFIVALSIRLRFSLQFLSRGTAPMP